MSSSDHFSGVDFRRCQRGSIVVEFALVITVFVTLVLGTIDLARWMYAIDAAGEAAREGARVAVVCSKSAGAITSKMQPSLATVIGGTATTTYFPSNACCAVQSSTCTACTGVSVRLQGYSVPRIAWFLPTMNIPTITTYLPREAMSSTDNPRCS